VPVDSNLNEYHIFLLLGLYEAAIAGDVRHVHPAGDRTLFGHGRSGRLRDG
jgi:hypothetical protein